MNIGVGDNDITRNYYSLDITEKRQEFYDEFYELIVIIHKLIMDKYPDVKLPSLDDLKNIKNTEIDEDLYMTGLYEDLIVFKELFAFYLDENNSQ